MRATLAEALPARLYNVAAGRNHRFSAVLETLHEISPTFEVERSTDAIDALYARSLRGPLDSARARRDLDWERTRRMSAATPVLDPGPAHRLGDAALRRRPGSASGRIVTARAWPRAPG